MEYSGVWSGPEQYLVKISKQILLHVLIGYGDKGTIKLVRYEKS